MQTTKLLSKLSSAFLASVHQPLPLDKRSSDRLLQALISSFRQNLDREHGYLSHRDSSTISAATLQNYSSSVASQASHHLPTDRHLRAILSNPLFSYRPSTADSSRPSTERDPMDVFDQAVAKGLMTLKRATGILVAKKRAIAQSPSISVPEAMAASRTAHRVVSWLRSSGLERDLRFVSASNQLFLNSLVSFMVQEKLDEIVWSWLERWMNQERLNGASISHETRVSPLLNALIEAKTLPGCALDPGYATLIRANDMFSDHRAFPTAVLTPWRNLSLMSTVFAWKHSPPSGVLFDSFSAMSELWNGTLGSFIKINRAHLDIHHPTRPDATAALQYLQSAKLDRLRHRLEKAGQTDQKRNSYARGSLADVGDLREPRLLAKSVVLMATDAAQHLTRMGKEDKAEWVGDRLLEALGDFLRTEVVSASPRLHRLQPGPAVT